GRLMLAAGEDPAPLEEFAAGADAHLVLARLPKSLAGLEDLARRLARLAAGTGREDLTLVAGGRVKHMTRSQNEVLAGSFTEVRASRGLGKSRALIASAPRPDAAAPGLAAGAVTVRGRGQGRGLALRGRGGVFGGARADAGSLLLLDALDAALVAGEVPAQRAVDLGSGNGLLTAHLAAVLSEAQVLGSDDDADAVASTRATLEASGLARDGVRVTWDEALSQEGDGSADLVLLNPPVHDGTVVDAAPVQRLPAAAARVRRAGGRPALRRAPSALPPGSGAPRRSPPAPSRTRPGCRGCWPPRPARCVPAGSCASCTTPTCAAARSSRTASGTSGSAPATAASRCSAR